MEKKKLTATSVLLVLRRVEGEVSNLRTEMEMRKKRVEDMITKAVK